MGLPPTKCLHWIPRNCKHGRLCGKGELRLWMELICWSADSKIGRLFRIIWVGPMPSQISSKMQEGIEREDREMAADKNSTAWTRRGRVSREEIWATPRSWKRWGDEVSPELLAKKCSPADSLIVAQCHLLTHRRLPVRGCLWENALIKLNKDDTKFVAIGNGSN